MGVRILHNHSNAVLYCSTTDWAFGPVFYEDDDHDAEERAEAFCAWLKVDARSLSERDLEARYHVWLLQEKAWWAAKEQAEKEEEEL